MKATEASLLTLIQGPKQFTIPIYQRPYSWTIEECARLLEDIKQVGLNAQRPTYFIGSVVYFEEAAHAIGTVPNYMVIDGQQRLTTMMLILTALANYLRTNGEPLQPDVTSHKLHNYYLTNPLEAEELFHRLLLTKRDKPTLINAISGHPAPAAASERVIANFAFFKEKIDSGNAYALWDGIKKLMVVSVALQSGIDNPQLIFESLNSTGKPLAQGDLIRNYVLMGQATEVQKELYNKFWFPMEEAFREDYAWMFNEFMRDFLTLKTSKVPNIYTVYQTFKDDYAHGKGDEETVRAMVSELYHFANYYVRLRQPKREEYGPLGKALEDLKTLVAAVAYPFLLEAYSDSEAGLLSKSELTEIVRLVESYVLRRAVCGIPTNSMSRMFAELGRQLNKQDYMNSVRTQFLKLGSYRRFPLDTEFRNMLATRNTYSAIRTRTYLLDRLENHKRKEKAIISEYTIEHILPQNENLSEEWQQELGPEWQVIRDKYLHTLGNLTLTGYNSELSDLPFATKKTLPGGFADSPIQLNKSVAAEPIWNEAAILRRADLLANWAVEIWPAPKAAAHGSAPEAVNGNEQNFHPESRNEEVSLDESLAIVEPANMEDEE